MLQGRSLKIFVGYMYMWVTNRLLKTFLHKVHSITSRSTRLKIIQKRFLNFRTLTGVALSREGLPYNESSFLTQVLNEQKRRSVKIDGCNCVVLSS